MDEFIENTSLETVFLFMFILLGVALISLAFAGIAVKSRDKANDAKPILREVVTIIEKQSGAPNSFVPVSDAWVVFQTDNGTRIRLYVKNGELYVVGDRGILTWQGTRVNDFQLLPRKNTNPSASPDAASNPWEFPRVFCRECGHPGTSNQDKCPKCGTPRK